MGEVAPDHLGGYVPGGDEATWYPHLWRYLVREFQVATMLDIGAAEGLTVDYFSGLGVDAYGIEGVPQPHDRVLRHDYTEGPWTGDPFLPARFDLGWSCEFVEHVEARHARNFIATFQLCDMLLMTHAQPGQAGHHHVNCQPAAYWTRRLERAGYVLDEGMTRETRLVARLNPSPWNHYAERGLAFRRRG